MSTGIQTNYKVPFYPVGIKLEGTNRKNSVFESFKQIRDYLDTETESLSCPLLKQRFKQIDSYISQQASNDMAKHVDEDKQAGWKILKKLTDDVKLAAIEAILEKYENTHQGHSHSQDLRADIESAITIAKTMSDPDSFEKDWAFRCISEFLVEQRDIDKAIEVANEIASSNAKDEMLWGISTLLMKERNIEKAIEVASKIPGSNAKDMAFKSISKALVKQCAIDKAIEAADKISDVVIKHRALS